MYKSRFSFMFLATAVAVGLSANAYSYETELREAVRLAKLNMLRSLFEEPIKPSLPPSQPLQEVIRQGTERSIPGEVMAELDSQIPVATDAALTIHSPLTRQLPAADSDRASESGCSSSKCDTRPQPRCTAGANCGTSGSNVAGMFHWGQHEDGCLSGVSRLGMGEHLRGLVHHSGQCDADDRCVSCGRCNSCGGGVCGGGVCGGWAGLRIGNGLPNLLQCGTCGNGWNPIHVCSLLDHGDCSCCSGHCGVGMIGHLQGLLHGGDGSLLRRQVSAGRGCAGEDDCH